MKLVIWTQYSENYGEADRPFWKFKGGDTYIVPNLTPSQSERILRDGVPTLKALIEYDNPMSRQHIVDYNVVDDDVVTHDEWESPYILSWENNTWVCRQTELNDGSFRRPVVSKITRYTMCMRGERSDFECSYEIEDGRIVPYDQIMDVCRDHVA
jgi:hypothetical protein